MNYIQLFLPAIFIRSSNHFHRSTVLNHDLLILSILAWLPTSNPHATLNNANPLLKHMTKSLALKIILGISLAGMSFSGYLSYFELAKATCPIGGCTTSLAGLPTCVYGFVLYTIVFVISMLGLRSKDIPTV